jgi:hypothetical protein
LIPCAVLHVDDRRLAGDRDRFLNAAHPKVGVDRECDAGRHLDARALDGVETLQAIGESVGSRGQVLDAILTRTVAHDGSNLLDQCRTGSFDRYTWKDSSRGIAHDAGDRLGRCQRWNDRHERSSEQNADRYGGTPELAHRKPPRLQRSP